MTNKPLPQPQRYRVVGGGGPPLSSSSSHTSHGGSGNGGGGGIGGGPPGGGPPGGGPPGPGGGNGGPPSDGPPRDPPIAGPNMGYQTYDTKTLLIDGRNLNVLTTPRPSLNYVRRRVWNKFTRCMLSAEERIAFDKQAGGFILPKGNKLRVQSTLTIDTDVLKNVHNLQYQIKALKAHVTEYDILDVFTIVLPTDPMMNTPDLEPTKYNLFDDYPKLTPAIVANSNAYYSRWVADEFIPDNLNLTYTMCKNNTEDNLFNKCLEDYERYHSMQQGGPLMLCLLLQRIHNGTEQHMEYLKLRVETLKISELEGESVDLAVSLVNAAYATFISVTTPSNDRIPPEWSKTLIHVFQTTSVPEFNETFKDEEKNARRDADKHGGQPTWPSHDELTKLATATYGRIKETGHWDVPASRKARSYPVLGSTQGRKPGPLTPTTYTRSCWSCGSADHMCNDCPKPRDEARIQQALKQFRSSRPPRKGPPTNRGAPNRGPNPQNRPPFKRIDGRAMKLNKKGAYVLDQREVRDQRNKDTLTLAMAALGHSDLTPTSPEPVTTPVPLNGTESLGTSDRYRAVPARTTQSIIAGLL